MEVENKQYVGVHEESIVILNPIRKMTKIEALQHAAWLVILADDHDEFDVYLDGVKK